MGSFVWYDLMTPDVAGARAFYGPLLGWEAGGGVVSDYHEIVHEGVHLGGMMQLSPEMQAAGARPAWLGYIAVIGIEAVAERISADGGAIHKPVGALPGVGKFAIVSDPQRAVFYLFESESGSVDVRPAPLMTPGHAGWHELLTSDPDAAFDFYSRHFGWTKGTAIEMGPMGTYQIFKDGAQDEGGIMRAPDPAIPSHWQFYFMAPDIGASTARVTELGGKVLHGPQEVPGGAWIIQGEDPQGVRFALVGMRGTVQA